jgi:hypothetical protein
MNFRKFFLSSQSELSIHSGAQEHICGGGGGVTDRYTLQ